jgi:hypothetical protein
MHRLPRQYGFAFLVFVALACASLLAGSAAVPGPVPDYALQSEEIYRLEIGAAFFVAFYLATMAVMLALSGRGFAEFGTRGLRAETVVSHNVREELDHRILEKLREASSDLEDVQERLKKLEAESLL